VRRAFLWSAVALIALLPLFGVQAATIPGDDVIFTYDDTTPFGTATVIGNSIFFSPTTFKAESLNGEGPVTMNETLQIDILVTTPGFVLDSFLLAEQGDYKLNGTGASVSANGQFRVMSLTKNISPIFPFPFQDDEFFDAGPLTVNTNTPVAWSASAAINLADTTGWNTDTEVRTTIENLLTATTLNSGVGETALIEKKFSGVGIIINPVPIPGAVWLFGSALGLLGWLRHRRS